jgi:hypothetical protein
MNGANPGSTAYPQPNVVGWGTANGSNATSTVLPGSAPASSFPSTAGTGQWSDVGPYSEAAENRTVGTTSVINNSIGSGTVGYQVLATITSGSIQSIGESFLTMSTVKSSTWTLNTNGLPNGTNTSLTVTTAGSPPGTPFYVQLNNEVLKVTTITSSTVFTIARAQNGSQTASASSGNILTLGNIPGAGTTNPNNGDLFAHAGFTALSLNNGDSIAFTWQVNVTS